MVENEISPKNMSVHTMRELFKQFKKNFLIVTETNIHIGKFNKDSDFFCAI